MNIINHTLVNDQGVVHDPRLGAVGEERIEQLACGSNGVVIACTACLDLGGGFNEFVEVSDEGLYFFRIIGAKTFGGDAAAIEESAWGGLVREASGYAIV